MQKKGIFYGWWVVVATSLIHFWGAGVFGLGFTAFFTPLVREFQWSYAATSFAASFRSLESGIAAPVVGFLTDRFGARRLIVMGVVLAGLGCMLLSRINSLWSYYATFVLVSIGLSMAFPLPGFTAVTNWFSRRRGIAMGIVTAALSAGGVLIPLITWLITRYGWRETLVIIGIGWWVLGIPLSLMVRQRPERYGYLPDGEQRLRKEIDTQVRCEQSCLDGDGSGFGVREATKTRSFWILALVSTFSSVAISAMHLHVMPALISIQMPPEVASSVAALLWVTGVPGRLGFGWLGDRMDKRYLLASALLLQALGLLVFAYTNNLVHAIVFLILFGPGSAAAITLRLAMQAEYFGRKAFGSIMGVMQGIHMVGTMLGPVFVGWIHDVRGSYQWAWLPIAMIVLLSVPLALMAKPPKEQMPQSTFS